MSGTLRVLVADDEAMARMRLVRLLGSVEDVVVVGEASDGTEVLAALKGDEPVDLVLLDVNMPNLDGLQTMGLMGPDGPLVVLTTAHAEHAVAAFDHGAVDYLLKPVDAARLLKALERARERRGPRARPTPAGRVPLPTRKGLVLIEPGDIGHAMIEGESVVVVTRRGRYYVDFRLSELEERLPEQFLRVHRQAIVNLERVERLEDADSGGWLAVLDDGTKIAVSRQVSRQLRRRWDLS
jgi:two-component system LytT family response regulator